MLRTDLRLIEDLATDLEGELAASQKTTSALEGMLAGSFSDYKRSDY